jgi:hypothetical protein
MISKGLRLVAHTIKPIEGFREEFQDRKVLHEAAGIAKRNKVFLAFYEGLKEMLSEIPEYIQKVAKREFTRRRLYEEALTEIAETAELEGIEFMVFKIKSFTYVGDDIDVFLPSKEGFECFIELLETIGYNLIGYGPPEATLAKGVQGFQIMIDVHRAFSASYMPYVNGSRVWRRRVKRKRNGLNVSVPSLEDELLILAGHSLLKEFRLNLAEFYHTLFLLPKANWSRLDKLARNEKMDYSLKIFLYTVGQMYEALYSGKLGLPIARDDRDILVKTACKVLSKSLKSGISMPYRFPLYLPVVAYLDKLRTGIVEGKGESLNFLLSFLKTPFTSKEGITVLWKYVTGDM